METMMTTMTLTTKRWQMDEDWSWVLRTAGSQKFHVHWDGVTRSLIPILGGLEVEQSSQKARDTGRRAKHDEPCGIIAEVAQP